MQLTRHTDYSLRILIYLAIRQGERVTLMEIAEAFDISPHHLGKVLQGLTTMGVVRSFRGKNGGMALARAPETIRVGEVVRTMESTLEIIDCNSPPCPIVPQCRLKSALNEARDAFLAVLDRFTVAELVHSRQSGLRRLLSA